MQEIHGKAGLDPADFIQVFDVPWFERPFQALHLVLELREPARAENRDDTAPGAQPV
jgi:hypothetical protein